MRHILRDALGQHSCGTHSPAAENQGSGHSPNPAPAHSSSHGNKVIDAQRILWKENALPSKWEENLSVFYYRQDLLKLWKNVLAFFIPMSAWPDPELVKIITTPKDSYSKGWVAECITDGIATEHRQAVLRGSSRSVWCQACTSCHCTSVTW